MSELISGKEALIALANGEGVEYRNANGWSKLTNMSVNLILNDNFTFRRKPRTITLNGVKVEQIHSSEWNHNNPQKVILEFKNEDAARFFQSKALEILNDMK